MNLEISGRTAFVAGASSGLGRAVAHALAAEGCSVALCSRSLHRTEAAARTIAEDLALEEGQLLPLECDVTDEDQIVDAFGRTVRHFGSLHILVTNAGGPPAGFVDDFRADDWRAAIELNLISTINLVRHALPSVRDAAREDGFGRIIMISSLSAKQPIPNLYLSNTARAGVQGFAKSLAEELGPSGITVNTVLPGYTRTDRLGELARSTSDRTGKSTAEIEAEWAEANAVKRLGEPEEFASAVTFLASRQAAYITGAAIPVDGGRSKHLL